MGVLTLQDAIKAAQEKELDLILMSESAVPPVCKIGDLGKYKYELEKKERILKKKQKVVEIKEVKIRPRIGEHDLQVKFKHIQEFLEEGDKVKISMVFKGREMAYQSLGDKIFQRLEAQIGALFVVEQQPKLEGTIKSAILAPKK